MSTTAGVGATDYVAVNTPSVVALVAGLASAAAMISPILLAIPVFALICAVMGWVQVGRSNGTQTGRVLCVLGAVLALAFGGIVVRQEVATARAFAESRREIGALFQRFAEATKVGDYEAAYRVFGPAFQSRMPFERFKGTLDHIASFPNYGRIVSCSWNERLQAVPDTSGQGNDFARAAVQVGFEHSGVTLACEVVLVRRRGDERWVIEQMVPLFQQEGSN
ncbi:MAG: hypothetical protein ACK4PI_04085 [Tepidisphaerales bacterium]